MKSGQEADSYHLLSDKARLPADGCAVGRDGAFVVTRGKQSSVSPARTQPAAKKWPHAGIRVALVAVIVLTFNSFSAIAAVGPETSGFAAGPQFVGNITGAHAAGLPRFSEITTGPRAKPAKPVADVAQGAANDAVVPPVKREQPAKPTVQPPLAQAPALPAPQPTAKKPEAVPPAQVGSKGSPSSSQGGGVVDAVQDWLARANREYQGVLMKQLSVPTNAGGDAIARKLDEQKAEDAKEAGEAKKLADTKKLEEESRKAAEAKQRQADDDRRKAEVAAKAEEARQAQVSKQAQAAKPPEPAKVEPAKPEPAKPPEPAKVESAKPEPAKPAEAAKKPEEQKKAEEPKKVEEAKKPVALVKPDDAKAAEERRNAEAASKAREAAQLKEAERVAEDRRKQELQRHAEQKKAEDDRRKADAAAAAKADEARRAEDARRKAEARAAEDKVADDKRRAQEAEAEKHRKRAVTITAEPVVRPPADPTPGRPELAVPDKPFKATKKDNRIAEGSAETGPVDDDGAEKSGSAKSNSESGGRSAHNRIRRWDWRPRRERHMSCRAAGRLVTPPAHYVVRRGDSLWRIAERIYHKGRHYRVIYRANRAQIADPDLIYPCQRFFLPLRR